MKTVAEELAAVIVNSDIPTLDVLRALSPEAQKVLFSVLTGNDAVNEAERIVRIRAEAENVGGRERNFTKEQ